MSRPASETERRLARASLGFGLAGLVLSPLIVGFVPAAIGFRAGLDVLARRGIPYGFLTGYGEVGLREAYRARPVLKKPFMQKDLIGLVTRLISPR